MVKNPEILAPGGSFSNAIHAFNSGADAVYIGLKNFSARKGAKNFTLNELRSIKNFCLENNKKVYVAINTLIKDSELPELLEILYHIEDINVDGIIVQDLGLAKIVKENFNLELHASTQMAAHNIHGVRFLKNYGFSRVVLSRELSFNEIKKIREQEPDIELEIFIHGALCYGFSGLCLASGKVLSRSANRGECGQICRTWFNKSGKKEFCFSMNDLFLSENILKLRDIGVESLKIEGRMKSSSYTSTVSSHYKGILSGTPLKTSKEECHIEFSRSGSLGYFNSHKGGAKVNPNYPGHLGLKIGEIVKKGNNSFTVKTAHKLTNRDGVMILSNEVGKENYKTSVNIIKQEKNRYILKGVVPKDFGSEVYKISKHDNNLKEYKSSSFKPYKTPIEISFRIFKDSIEISCSNKKYSYPIDIEEAKSEVDIVKQLKKVFGAGGETAFCFNISILNSFIGNPFLPNSILKQVRNKFLDDFIGDLAKTREEKTLKVLNNECNLEERCYKAYIDDIPFITDFTKININNFKVNDKILLPLSPVIFDSEKYLGELLQFIDSRKGETFVIGLNNISHFEYIKHLPEVVEYYCDYGIYTTNKFSKSFILNYIPNVKWSTKWVENDISEDSPPVFISRTCMKKGNGECPLGCTKNYSYVLTQNSIEYRVEVRDCMTYTFMES